MYIKSTYLIYIVRFIHRFVANSKNAVKEGEVCDQGFDLAWETG
jgi:hypothetical protein